MKRRFYLILPAVFLLFAICETAFAGSGFSTPLPKGFGSNGGDFLLNGPVNIDANNLSYDEENGIASAEGNVVISLGLRKILADRVSYNFRTGEADMEGNVRYEDSDGQFSFERITLNLNTETGVLYNGIILISSNNYRISGEKIEKTGEQSYELHKGSITTCPCDPTPDWEFSVRNAGVVLDGYAVSKNITIRARGIPVFWLPYAFFPVKLSRQSGFLIPYASRSRSSGFILSVPYYWAINSWSDATITVDVMEKRGIRPDLEYRFALNKDSDGVIRGNFIRDEKIHQGRWRIYGQNVFHSGDWTANAKVELPSDNQYYMDLEYLNTLRAARHTFSTGFVGWSGEHSSHQLSATWVKEMERDSSKNTLQRLPEYQATLLPSRFSMLGDIEASGEMSGTYFFREEGDRALRARGLMTLSRTFVPLPSVSLMPYISGYAIGARYGHHDIWNDAGRFVPVAGFNMAAEAQRSFLENGSGFVHVVGTNIDYRHVSYVNQDNMPVHDRWSRLDAQNQFVFTVNQRLFGLGNAASPREIASMTLEWAYDLRKRRDSVSHYVDPLAPFVRVLQSQVDLGAGRMLRTGSASDIYGRVTLLPFQRWSFSGEMLLDPANAAFTMAAVGLAWEKDIDHRFGLSYRISHNLAEDIGFLFALRPLRFLKLKANINYSLHNARLTSSSATIALIPKSECWSIGLAAVWTTYPRYVMYRLVFDLKGIGSSSDK